MDDATLRHNDPDATTARPNTLRCSDATNDELVTAIAPYGDTPDECTIFPAELIEDELLTTWLSVQEGAYVVLAEMR